MNALVQSQCTLAIKWLKPRRGKDIANQFCVYCMVVMQFVRLSGFALCDCGEHNLAVSRFVSNTAAAVHRHAGVERPRRS